jgi:hypothetical protein
MNFEKYENTDIYIHQNIGSSSGYNIKYSLDKMKQLAETMDCNIIVKTGKKWYLKRGLYKPTLNFLLFNQRKGFYPNIITYVKRDV